MFPNAGTPLGPVGAGAAGDVVTAAAAVPDGVAAAELDAAGFATGALVLAPVEATAEAVTGKLVA